MVRKFFTFLKFHKFYRCMAALLLHVGPPYGNLLGRLWVFLGFWEPQHKLDRKRVAHELGELTKERMEISLLQVGGGLTDGKNPSSL